MDGFDLNQLPKSIIPMVKFGIKPYAKGEIYGEFDDF